MKQLIFILLGMMSFNYTYADEEVEKNIKAGLANIIPDMKVGNIVESPIKGIYQVMLGADVIYMTKDGHYLIKGDILDLQSRQNLTDDVRAENRKSLLHDINPKDYIEFAAEEQKKTIYVFTDVDCGYCRKLHQDVPELNTLGVTVRYLAYPRAGIGSATAKEMSDVWCAKDRKAALTAAKNRESVESSKCDDPVANQYALGQAMGVRGTPAIFSENGEMLPGYMPPNEILSRLK